MTNNGTTLWDKHGRAIQYVRVSLTAACNYRCIYCMPDDDVCSDSTGGLARDETLRLCRLLAGLGIANFKITGGEPFMSPDAMAIIASLKSAPNIDCVTVTTNGSMLDRHLPELAALGIDGVNVSINALTQKTHDAIAGIHVPVDRILKNIVLAKKHRLRIKLNMVPLRGMNENEIVPLLEFAFEHDIPVRFIELMPMGQGRCHTGLSLDEVRQVIEQRFGATRITGERFGNGPATYLAVGDFQTRIGYIAAVSQRFCASCNRLRLTSAGYLRTCLHHENNGADLAAPLRRGDSDETIARHIREAVAAKPERHFFHEQVEETGQEPMYRIGG